MNSKTNSLRQATHEGAGARFFSIPKSECPYPVNSLNYAGWIEGYTAAEDYENELHNILSSRSYGGELDRQFPLIMRISGLVARDNLLAKMVADQTRKEEEKLRED